MNYNHRTRKKRKRKAKLGPMLQWSKQVLDNLLLANCKPIELNRLRAALPIGS